MVFQSQPMSGLCFVSNYGSLIFEFMRVSRAELSHIQVGAQIPSISGSIITFFVADFVGRRPKYITGCISLRVLMIFAAISGSFPHDSKAVTSSVGFLIMFNFLFNAGVWSIVYILVLEVPTSVIRGKTLILAMIADGCINM